MVKVLFAGDVGGKVEALFKRVSTVNSSSAGPFDLLLCIGGFFASSGGRSAQLTGDGVACVVAVASGALDSVK
jgi:hypothetical protein